MPSARKDRIGVAMKGTAGLMAVCVRHTITIFTDFEMPNDGIPYALYWNHKGIEPFE